MDSALKKSKKMDDLYEKDKIEPKHAEINISWKQFKNQITK